MQMIGEMVLYTLVIVMNPIGATDRLVILQGSVVVTVQWQQLGADSLWVYTFHVRQKRT